MIQALVVLLPVVYAAAAALALIEFSTLGAGGGARTPGLPWRVGAYAAALALHVALFAARAASVTGTPSFEGWWAISALAFAVATLHLVVAARQGTSGTDPIVLTTVLVLQLAASAFAPLDTSVAPDRPIPFYLLHVTSILVASAALVLSGLHGCLYLMLFRQMRQRRLGNLFERLPSLHLLAQLMRRTALVACLLLLLGSNGGIWWAHAAQIPGFTYGDPVVILSLLLSVYFGAVAFSRRIPGLTARRASFAAAVGLLLLIASLGLFLAESNFHWTR